MYILAATIFATGIIIPALVSFAITYCMQYYQKFVHIFLDYNISNVFRSLPAFCNFTPSGCNLLPNILQPSSRYIATFIPAFCNLLSILFQPSSQHFATFFSLFCNLLPSILQLLSKVLQPSPMCFATFFPSYGNFLPSIPSYGNHLPSILQPSPFHRIATFFPAICTLLPIVWQQSFYPTYCKPLHFNFIKNRVKFIQTVSKLEGIRCQSQIKKVSLFFYEEMRKCLVIYTYVILTHDFACT